MRQLPRELWFLRKRENDSPPWYATGLHSWILRNWTWQSPEHNTVLGKLQWKCLYSPMANTPENMRDWKQPLKTFNSCRQTQSIKTLWSFVWWGEHHWELNAIILCKCHVRRLHVVKFFCLKCNIYESHNLFINLQVVTIDHYIIEIKSKCYLWVWRTKRGFN